MAKMRNTNPSKGADNTGDSGHKLHLERLRNCWKRLAS